MSKKTVSIWAKKNFILWFLESYQFQSDSPKRFLSYLVESEELLARICLVYNGTHLRPLLVISSDHTGMPPLFLKTADKNTTDSLTILQHLQTNRENPIYLTLYFPDRRASEPYQAVVEETFPEAEQGNQFMMDFELSLLIEACRLDMERAHLMRQIDQSLDKGNKRTFMRLVKKLKNLL